MNMHSFNLNRSMATFLALALFACGSGLWAEEEEQSQHRGGSVFSLDITSMVNAFSQGDRKKKKKEQTATPTATVHNDRDCPERYKALIAVLARLSPSAARVADAVKDCNDATQAEQDARQAKVEAYNNLLRAEMMAQADRDGDPGLQQAHDAYNKATEVYNKSQEQSEAARNYLKVCVENYNRDRSTYEDNLKTYNAHCSDYKVGPPFPAMPTSPDYVPPSVPDIPAEQPPSNQAVAPPAEKWSLVDLATKPGGVKSRRDIEADMDAFNTLMVHIFVLEMSLDEEYDDAYELSVILDFIPNDKDKKDYRTLAGNMNKLLQVINANEILLVQLQGIAAQLYDILAQETRDPNARAKDYLAPPHYSPEFYLIPFGPGAVYAKRQLDNDSAGLYNKVHAAQEDAYLKEQAYFKACHESSEADLRARRLETAQDGAASKLESEKSKWCQACVDYHHKSVGTQSSVDVSWSGVEKARDELQKQKDLNSKSPELAQAKADEKAAFDASSAARDATAKASGNFEALRKQYEKQVGPYPTREVLNELQQEHGPLALSGPEKAGSDPGGYAK
ncbi:MAG: hypothetical protein PHD76_03870 [Methylacidiphilales bacterium]|nr:hypothetical protein [Candidatus Methylacidiphilales bacterium]